MSLSALSSRIGPSLAAAAAGWAAALAVTLPMQLFTLIVNAVGGDLWFSLGTGALIWAAWSLAIASGGWVVGFLPVIAFVPEDWLLHYPRATVALAGILGWSFVLFEFEVWTLVLPDHTIGVKMFVLYSLLLIVFPAVSAAVYLRLIARKATLTGSSPSL